MNCGILYDMCADNGHYKYNRLKTSTGNWNSRMFKKVKNK